MSEETASPVNAAQIEYWNAAAGETWAQYQEQLDRQIAPLGLEALRTLAPAKGEAVMRVTGSWGCAVQRKMAGQHRTAAVLLLTASNRDVCNYTYRPTRRRCAVLTPRIRLLSVVCPYTYIRAGPLRHASSRSAKYPPAGPFPQVSLEAEVATALEEP